MARGGRREGAGRKKGAVSKMTLRAREEAARTGMLPHEFLLNIMRGGEAAKQCLGRDSTNEERIDAAKAAAPFYAPKLAATAFRGHLSPDGEDEDNAAKWLLEMVNGKSRTLPSERAATKKPD